jgi:hypothetical protein
MGKNRKGKKGKKADNEVSPKSRPSFDSGIFGKVSSRVIALSDVADSSGSAPAAVESVQPLLVVKASATDEKNAVNSQAVGTDDSIEQPGKKRHRGRVVFPYVIAIIATALLLLATASSSFRANLWGETTLVTVLTTPVTGWAVGNCVAFADAAHDEAKAVVCTAVHYGVIVARASTPGFCPNESLANSSVLPGPKNTVFCVLSTVN